MIRVDRGELPSEMQGQLDQLQQAVDQNAADAQSWDDFSKTETYKSLKTEMYRVFHRKCAYCEGAEASDVEHHWPKSPHRHNAMRGSTAHMFQWRNMVLSCSTCNGFGGKAAHMQWGDDGSAKLFNPCEDEPLCYFRINLEETPPFAIGWIDPRPLLKPVERDRAEYTITRLKLNTRDALLRGRARTLRNFLAYAYLILEMGPNHESPPGKPIRDTFLKMLDADEPFLSPIRQILYFEPDYQSLYERLSVVVPEIEPIIASWSLTPLGCSSLNQETAS